VKFTKTETGGSCTPGCHKVKDYDRTTPVDYTMVAPVKKAEPVKEKDVPDDVEKPDNEPQTPLDESA
jgi:hypothetical protein